MVGTHAAHRHLIRAVAAIITGPLQHLIRIGFYFYSKDASMVCKSRKRQMAGANWGV